MRIVLESAAAILLLGLCGCGTITGYSFPEENPEWGPYYTGVRLDVQEIKRDRYTDENRGVWTFWKICAVIDTPLSCIGDTLFAPLKFFRRRAPEPKIVATNQVEQVTK
jgi:uncharacterized protein YceK